MDWKEYEKEVFRELQERYPGAAIQWNVRIPGRISGTLRQIDILIDTQVLDAPIRIVVDAKKHSGPVDVNDVESFISMMLDVGAHRGILVSNLGYTKSALARAHNEMNQDVELDILSLEDLKELQGTLAFPYSGSHGVLLPAPFGWVIDAKRRQGSVACLYQRGYDLQEAGRTREWMYINFWRKEQKTASLDALLEIQANTLKQADERVKISYQHGVDRADGRTLIRCAEVASYPTPEYTGFVEFDDFIFFAVLFTPPETSKRNIRKLREILRSVSPINVRHT